MRRSGQPHHTHRVGRIDADWLTEQNELYRWRTCPVHETPMRAETAAGSWTCPAGRCVWMPLDVRPGAERCAAVAATHGRAHAPRPDLGLPTVLAWTLATFAVLGTSVRMLDLPWWAGLAALAPTLAALLTAHGHLNDRHLMRFAAATGMHLAGADTLAAGDLVSLPGAAAMLPVTASGETAWALHHPGDDVARLLSAEAREQVWVLPAGTDRHRAACMDVLESLPSPVTTRPLRAARPATL